MNVDNGATRQAYVTLAISTMLMGSAFTASKFLVEAIPHQVAALLRFGLGGLVMFGCLVVTRRGVTMPLRTAGRVVFAGVFGVFGYNALFFWGLSLAPSVDGSVIVPILSPVITTALAFAVLGDKSTRAHVFGLVLGIAGAVVFLIGASGGGGAHRLAGDLVYLGAALSWSIYTLMGKRLLVGLDPLKTSTYATLGGAALLAVAAGPQLGATRWGAMTAGDWVAVAYLVVGPTVIAYVFYYRGVKQLGPAVASMMLFLAPAVGLIGGTVILHESLNLAQSVGTTLMVAGALFAIVRRPHGTSRRTPAVAVNAERRSHTVSG